MKTIYLRSSDARLVAQIRDTLADGERLVRAARDEAPAMPSANVSDALIVLDCRRMDRREVMGALPRARTLGESRGCRVAIASRANANAIEVVGQTHDRATEVILADHAAIASRIRCLLNDPTGSASAAVALVRLSPRLPAHALRIAELVLSSGCRISSVKQVSKVIRHDRSWLNDHLWAEGAGMPKQVVKLSQLTCAVVVLRGTRLAMRDIAEAVAYGAARTLGRRLQATFGTTCARIREDCPMMETERYLDRLLDAWQANGKAGRQAVSQCANWPRHAGDSI
ncbi:MAG TPA: hypothetical protein VJL28_07305 [Gemmatimonadaceae bacterium]|nr:hypothetical protein [Gemmatimonadaceae bacterium]